MSYLIFSSRWTYFSCFWHIFFHVVLVVLSMFYHKLISVPQNVSIFPSEKSDSKHFQQCIHNNPSNIFCNVVEGIKSARSKDSEILAHVSVSRITFCKANDLDLLKFCFEFHLGGFAFYPKKFYQGFLWFKSGQKINPNIELSWNFGEPNYLNGKEWCTSAKQLNKVVKFSNWHQRLQVHWLQISMVTTPETKNFQKFLNLTKKRVTRIKSENKDNFMRFN